MKIGVVVFPGSNCDRDMADAVQATVAAQPVFIWHGDTDLQGVDALMIPGGFSYGDYLRCGAIARFSPVMASIRAFSEQGRPVLGVCNGFQILTEAGLLPGCLLKNTSLKFQCESVALQVESNRTVFTQGFAVGEIIHLPIAHAEGNYQADPDTLKRLEDQGQVVMRYTTDVNGAAGQIAGISNERGTILGMMPHPERSLWTQATSTGDGRRLFTALKQALSAIC
jgi:phosphoribosylformylglycinamidine synthase subunit PurQ / glutaminase